MQMGGGWWGIERVKGEGKGEGVREGRGERLEGEYEREGRVVERSRMWRLEKEEEEGVGWR